MSQTVRVLHIFGRMNRGGAETFIMNVYRHIDRTKIQFDFAVHSDQPGHYDEEIRSLGGRIFILPRPRLTALPVYKRALAQVLREEGPFATVHSHVHFYSGVPLAVAASAGIPVRIAHSHSTSDGKRSALSRRLYRWYMRSQIWRYATHMLGCSRPACEALYGPRCWQDSRVRVVHYGIDPTPFELLPKDRNLLRDRIGLPRDCLLIGHVGRFEVPKNHRFLVEIFGSLAARLPTARLVLVGDGPLRPQIEQLVSAKGLEKHVLFLGVRADVPEIMGCLDVFLFPSQYEGLGIVLIEAQMAGVPCVVSNVIPDEADLELGLIDRVNLESPLELWVESIMTSLHVSRPDWNARTRALREKGYNIQASCTHLERIYLSSAFIPHM
jgi:glycosyltransferase involved in cell wall biosynthesis